MQKLIFACIITILLSSPLAQTNAQSSYAKSPTDPRPAIPPGVTWPPPVYPHPPAAGTIPPNLPGAVWGSYGWIDVEIPDSRPWSTNDEFITWLFNMPPCPDKDGDGFPACNGVNGFSAIGPAIWGAGAGLPNRYPLYTVARSVMAGEYTKFTYPDCNDNDPTIQEVDIFGNCPKRPLVSTCTDPANIFKGSLVEVNGKPWIETIVDPKFEAKMVKERDLKAPLPLTPLYDMVVRIKPEFDYTCIPGWTPGKEVKATDLPAYIDVTAEIVVGVKNEAITGRIAFLRSNEKDKDGKFIYQRFINGWNQGVAHGEKMEKLVTAIANKEPVRIQVRVPKQDGSSESHVSPLSLSNCVQVSGGTEHFGKPPHRVVHMRSKSSEISVAQMDDSATYYREKGFEKIEPFKTYSKKGDSYFAHFVDLLDHDDTKWSVFAERFFVAANSRPRAISSCGTDASQYFFPTKRLLHNINYAPYGGGIAFLNVNTGNDATTATHAGVTTAIHEVGHSFAWLEDEYHSGYDVTLYYANCAPTFSRNSKAVENVIGPNKILRNKVEKYLRKVYWGQYGDVITGCHTNSQVRPSQKSIMNAGDFHSDQFNVVSCGHIVGAITGKKDLRLLFDECMKMDGLEKPITGAPVAAAFLGIPPDPDPVFAQQVDTRTGIDPTRLINVEMFLPNGEIRSEVFDSVTTRRIEPDVEIEEITSYDPERIIPGDYIEVTASRLDPSENRAELTNVSSGKKYEMAGVITVGSKKLVFTLPKDFPIARYDVRVGTKRSALSSPVTIEVQSHIVRHPDGASFTILHPGYAGVPSPRPTSFLQRAASFLQKKTIPSPTPTASPLATITPRSTPASTISPSPSTIQYRTSTPIPTPTRTPTPSPTTILAPTISAAPTPIRASATPSPTVVSTPNATPVSTPISSPTPTPTPSSSASPSPSPSSSSSPSSSPTTSSSPTPTSSPVSKGNRTVLAAILYAIGDFLDALSR